MPWYANSRTSLVDPLLNYIIIGVNLVFGYLMFATLGMFLKPLPKTDGLNLSGGNLTPNFNKVSTENFVSHLNTEEQEKLEDVEEETDDNWLKTAATPSPVARKKRKTVNFVQSPKFLSPRRSFR